MTFPESGSCSFFVQKPAAVKPAVQPAAPARKKDTSSSSEESDSDEEPAKTPAKGELKHEFICALLHVYRYI